MESEKWKDAKRKIIILQFLIKWQWKLLAGVVVCVLPVARYAELKLLETKTHYERPKSLGKATTKTTKTTREKSVDVQKNDEDEMLTKLLMAAHNLLKCKHQAATQK